MTRPVGTTLRKPRHSKNLNVVTDTKHDTFGDSTEIPSKGDGSIKPDNAVTTTQPPFTYAQTENASCSELADMIQDVQGRINKLPTREAVEVYQAWISYAAGLYNNRCRVTQAPPADYPATDKPEAPNPSIDDPQPGVGNGGGEPEPGGVLPTTDDADPVRTIEKPKLLPYPVVLPTPSAAGGGGGGADDGGEEPSYRNWFWIVFAAIAVVGYITHKPKK